MHVHIVYGAQGIRSTSLNRSKTGLVWSFSSQKYQAQLEDAVHEWLEAYSQKRISLLQIPLDWVSVPRFTQEVLQIVAHIPLGSTSTYGQIAHLIGRPKAARAVGGACARNPFLLFIPCHRIIDAKLNLRGFSAGGTEVKKEILDFEKI